MGQYIYIYIYHQKLLWIYIYIQYSLSELFLNLHIISPLRSLQTMEKRAKEQMTEVEQAMNKARRADLRRL